MLPLVPHPPDRGDRLRAWDMLAVLAEMGELHLALVVREEVTAATREALAAVARALHVFPLTGRDVWGGRVRGGLSGLPPAITAYWSPRIRRELAERCPGPWDLAVAFQLRTAPYALALPARARVLELTDSLALYRGQLPWRGRALLQKLAFTGVERLERRLPREFTSTVVSAPADADVVERLAHRRPVVVPNGTPPAGPIQPYRTAGPLLFVGDMRYPPNEDGITWFAHRVWPQVRQALPDLTLRIVGRTTPATLRLARIPGVEVAGYVPDAQVELAAALAVINPMRFGSGTNRKVLDAFAAGRPVLSTPVGVRGLACREGEHVMVPRDVAGWVAAVVALRMEPERGARLGLAGRALLAASAQPEAWKSAFGGVLESRDTGCCMGAQTGV